MTVLPDVTSTTYNILSHKNTNVNAQFDKVDYRQIGQNAQLVHGAYIRAVFVKVLTNASITTLVEFNANHSIRATVTHGERVIFVGGTQPEAVVDNLKVRRAPRYCPPFREKLRPHSLTQVRLSDRVLTVTTPEWTVNARSKVKRTIIGADTCATGKCFLEVGLIPHFDADHTEVAPHGLIGQTWCAASLRKRIEGECHSGVWGATCASGLLPSQ